MNNKIKQLEYKLNQEKNKYGLVGAKPAKIQEYEDVDHDIAASINPNNWGIEVILKTGYNPIKDTRQKAYARVKKIKDALEAVVLQVGSGHEVAHWELPYGSGKGCPMDVYHHDKILEGVKKGLPKEKKEHFAGDVANMFEDTIINPRVKEYFGDFSGHILFWDNEGLLCQKKTRKKGFPPLYEAFIKINMHLFGDKYDELLLKRHYTKNRKVTKAVKEVIKNLNFPKDIQDTTPLFDKAKWPLMAENYAKAISDLLDKIPDERRSAYDPGQSQNSSGGSEEQIPKPGNGVEKQCRTKKGKEEIAYGRYSAGESQSPNFKSFEQLDSLYQRLAKDIAIKVEAISRESSMEISPLTHRIFDPETDNPLKIKTSKFFFNKDGFNFAYKDKPLTIDYKHKIQRKSFPNFKMVLVDNSGSMANGLNGDSGSKKFIPFGDNSKYHYALLGYYGIENFLQKQGIAPYIMHGVSLFSNSTRFKKGNYNDLIETRKLLFHPNWDTTNLDASVLKQALDGEKSFLLSISDGGIGN